MVELIQHLLKVFDLVGKDFGILDSKLLVYFIFLLFSFIFVALFSVKQTINFRA